MDWIAALFGPLFLLFYLFLGGSVFTIVFFANRRTLHTVRQMAPLDERDPYRLAYLRGGETALIRLALFRLLDTSQICLSADEKKRPTLEAAGDASSFAHTRNGLETQALQAASTPILPLMLIQNPSVIEEARRCGGHYRYELEGAGLLTSETGRTQIAGRSFAGLVFTLFAGGFKYLHAIETGHHNVGFLLLMSLGFLIAFGVQMAAPRLTDAGKKAVEELSECYRHYRTGLASAQGNLELSSVVVSLFGMGVLASTPHAALGAVFQSSASSAAGGCGGGCGSGCGGGGCGGGGCGGGGCGGCGGG